MHTKECEGGEPEEQSDAQRDHPDGEEEVFVLAANAQKAVWTRRIRLVNVMQIHIAVVDYVELRGDCGGCDCEQ